MAEVRRYGFMIKGYVSRREAFLGAASLSLLAAACGRNTPQDGAIARNDVNNALDALAKAPEHGFSQDQFAVERIRKLGDDGDLKTRDRLLYAQLVAYGQAQHGRSIPRKAMPADWTLRSEPYDAEASLRQAVKAGDFKDWLEQQPPQSDQYKTLQSAYLNYLKIVAGGVCPTVADAG